MDISLKIKTLRLEKKMEQTELSELMNMSSAMISMYELGKKKPSLKAIYKLSEIFGVNPNYFLEEKLTESSSIIKSESISEKLYSELKLQFEFLQRNFERVIEENGRLSRTLENLTSTGNFLEGNNLSASPISEVVALAAA